MTAIANHIKKDLILCRIPILLWCTYWIVYAVNNWNIDPLADRGLSTNIIRLTLINPYYILGTFMVAFIALTDPITNNDSFWHTKPLRGRSLFVSKITTITACVYIPLLLVTLALGTRHGFDRNFWFQAFENIESGLFLLSSYFVASISKSITQYAFIAIGAWIAFMFSGITHMLLLGNTLMAWSEVRVMWSHVTELNLYLWVLSFFLIALSFFQVTTRKTILSVSTLALLIVILGFSYKRTTTALVNPPTDPTGSYNLNISSIIKDIPQTRRSPITHKNERVDSYYLKMDLDPTGDSDQALVMLLEGRLETESHTYEPSYSLYYRMPDVQLAYWDIQKLSNNVGFKCLNLADYKFDSGKIQILDIESEYLKNEKSPNGTYTGKFGAVFFKYQKIATLPLKESEALKFGEYIAKIDTFRIIENQITVSIKVAYRHSPYDSESPSWKRGDLFLYLALSDLLVLYNPKKQEGIVAYGGGGQSGGGRNNYIVSEYESHISLPSDLSEEWLDNAELLIFTKEIVHVDEREIVLNDFKL